MNPTSSQKTGLARSLLLCLLTTYIAFVFIQSLFYKFTDSPETQYIFGTLNSWGTSLGFPGLFDHHGIFSQYVVGTTELIASSLLLFGLIRRHSLVQVAGATLSVFVISGAIFFHLFTPLGISVLNADGTRDGGELFGLACGVWLASIMILFMNRLVISEFIARFFIKRK
ncbi:DoxX family membrane protein [Undibacterium sp. Ji67W]